METTEQRVTQQPPPDERFPDDRVPDDRVPDERVPVVAIMGATATGKSRLAMRLAEELDGEIVNADALQIYRGLDIGTAKPESSMLRRVPHHLVDILQPEEAFSAGEFVRRATSAIEDIQRRGRLAILVGGTGLYFRALLDGLSPLPEIDAMVRQEVRAMPVEVALERLRELDLDSAERLAPADRQRIQRALEVVLSSGRPISEWQRLKPSADGIWPARRIGLTMQRGLLYDRIADRVQGMVADGWVSEVQGLLERGVAPTVPAFQAIGYRQLVRHVLGEWSLEAALDDTIRATRRYAKRQVTWFRKERAIRWLPALDTERAIPTLLRELHGVKERSLDEQA